MMKETKILMKEVPLTDDANELYASGEWCKPEWSEKRDAWMMTKRVKS